MRSYLRASYSSPNDLELAGTREAFSSLRQALHAFLDSKDAKLDISIDRDFDPAPYDQVIPKVRCQLGAGPTRVSVTTGPCLTIEGSRQNLIIFSSWLDFERATAPSHQHYEYYDDNAWVSEDSLPLVISHV